MRRRRRPHCGEVTQKHIRYRSRPRWCGHPDGRRKAGGDEAAPVRGGSPRRHFRATLRASSALPGGSSPYGCGPVSFSHGRRRSSPVVSRASGALRRGRCRQARRPAMAGVVVLPQRLRPKPGTRSSRKPPTSAGDGCQGCSGSAVMINDVSPWSCSTEPCGENRKQDQTLVSTRRS